MLLDRKLSNLEVEALGSPVEGNNLQEKLVLATRRLHLTPLRYPGGKRRLIPGLANLITAIEEPIELYIEPFAGSGALAIAMLESGAAKRIALNDRDDLIAAFWRIVFSDRAEQLFYKIGQTRVTLAEWQRQKVLTPRTDLQRAFKCLYLNRTSFSGVMNERAGPIGGYAQESAHSIDCRFNRQRIQKRIEELAALKDRVQFVRCADYRRIISDVQKTTLAKRTPKKILWYLDPPFFRKAESLYRFYFTSREHNDLKKRLGQLPGNWILSYDDVPESRKLYGRFPGLKTLKPLYSAKVNTKRRAVSELVLMKFC